MKKIVFCGFGKLGKVCVKALISQGYEINFIMTHQQNGCDSVDSYAQEMGIDFTYVDARKQTDSIVKIITKTKCDLLVSVNYRYIIPKEVFSLVKYSINIHGSLLPRYRGRTPHVWSIINGEKESGITCHLIEEKVDTGDIVMQKIIPIDDDDTGYSLLEKFELNYPSLLIKSINRIDENIIFVKQDDKNASYFGKRTPDMGYIDFRKTARDVINFVRAQAEPYPGAYYYLLDGRKIIINKICVDEIYPLDIPQGVIREINNNYFVRCNDRLLKIVKYRIIN